jgi:hypothetical protein
MRCATVRGPSPASISMTLPCVRTTELLPADPLPSTHSSIDIRVLKKDDEALRTSVRRYGDGSGAVL